MIKVPDEHWKNVFLYSMNDFLTGQWDKLFRNHLRTSKKKIQAPYRDLVHVTSTLRTFLCMRTDGSQTHKDLAELYFFWFRRRGTKIAACIAHMKWDSLIIIERKSNNVTKTVDCATIFWKSSSEWHTMYRV